MTAWLRKPPASDLFEAYPERRYVLNLGYAVPTDSINPEDPTKDLVATLDLDGSDGPLAGTDVVHTLRFLLLSADTVYPAISGTTDEEHAVIRGDLLGLPPLNGDGIVALSNDP